MVADPPPEADSGPDDLDELLSRTGRGGSRKARPRSDGKSSWRAPFRRWRSADELDDELEGPRSSATREDEGRRVYWRARDSLWFEPLVALAIIVVLLVSLFAYTSNWPPVYVVESNSMQHGAGDHLGVLNAGDVVLAQKTDQAGITPYFSALHNGGPSTYGELGDVVLYYPNGATSATPVIHRALVFLQYDPQGTGSYNATQLQGLPCGNTAGADYYTPGTTGGCGTVGLTGTLILDHVGWKDVTITVDIHNCLTDLGGHSGFLTLGDNNSYADQVPSNTCLAGTPISTLVEPGWIIGVARGLLPWFGSIKLFLDGNSQLVPSASWEYLGLSVAGILIAAAGLHFLLRRLGVRSELRRREERRAARQRDREDDFADDEAPARPMHSWRERDPDDAPDPPPRPKLSYDDRRRTHVTARTRPRRPHGPPKDGSDDEDDTASE